LRACLPRQIFFLFTNIALGFAQERIPIEQDNKELRDYKEFHNKIPYKRLHMASFVGQVARGVVQRLSLRACKHVCVDCGVQVTFY
jgi:hypothetical protein